MATGVLIGVACTAQRGPALRRAGSEAVDVRSTTGATSPELGAETDSDFAYPWQPDQGDGSYGNPIIFADYSDPDVIHVGDDYYMVASSFNCTPGLPILRSPDLVNWTIIGHALENLPDARYRSVRHGEGIGAPSLREHDGKFYIFAPTPDEGIYVLTAERPEGPWSEPRMLLEGKGLIDPSPLWDDDGKAYLVHAYALSRAGIRDRLQVRPMAPDASRMLGEGEVVFHEPPRQPAIEGPKFYKREGWYYILASAGGVATGWQVALRSRDVYGPYEDRVVLQRGNTELDGPYSGGLVESSDGRSWFLHSRDAGLYGRVVHLNPVTWEEGWPLMGVEEEGTGAQVPVLRHDKPEPSLQPASPRTSDEFAETRLGLQWQWHANHDDDWASLHARPGFLRLLAQPQPAEGFASTPNLLLQKLPARSFTFRTEVHPEGIAEGTRAGVIVMGARHAVLALEPHGEDLQLTLLEHGSPITAVRLPRAPTRLTVTMQHGGYCRFGFQSEGQTEQLLTRGFQAEPGRWVGAKIGLFAVKSSTSLEDPAHGAFTFADFAYARFAPPIALPDAIPSSRLAVPP